MNFIRCDETEDPIIKIKFHPVEVDKKSFSEYLAYLDDLYNRFDSFVLILDGSEAKYLPSEYRIAQAKWMKGKAELMKNQCKGLVFIVNNVITKMLLDGIFMINKPPVDYFITSTLENANQWAKQKVWAIS